MAKICPACKSPGPFGRCKTRKDGKSYLCLACRRLDQVAFYANSQEKIRAMRERNRKAVGQ